MTPTEEESTGLTHSHIQGEDVSDRSTGLPWPRTWRGVYLFVIGCFVTWVTLLVVLERAFP